MANLKQEFGTVTGMTITLAGLTTALSRESSFISNVSDKFVDALVTMTAQLQAGAPASDKGVLIYAYGSAGDDGNYTDNATGVDAPITLRDPTNFKLIGFMSTPDSGGLTYKSHPMSVAAAFGGIMPRRWGIVVQNKTGLSFTSVAGASFTGIFATLT